METEPYEWASRQDSSAREDDVAGEEAILITDDMLADNEAGDTRIDFEKDISCFPRLILALIAINIAVFVWEVVAGALETQDAIIAAGALHRAKVLDGEIWRLVSAMFLHVNMAHLVGNCIALYILGIACEHGLGFKQTLLVYFVSGLCGSCLSVAMHAGPSAGASGAVFGIMGSLTVFLYKYQNLFLVRNKRIGVVFLIWALYEIGLGFVSPFVDNFAHVGGFLGGGIVTLFLRPALLATPDRPTTEELAQGTG